jgi:hypothetical protein
MKKLLIVLLFISSNIFSQDMFLNNYVPLSSSEINLHLPDKFGDGIDFRDSRISPTEFKCGMATILVLIPTTLSIVGVLKGTHERKAFYGALIFDTFMITILTLDLTIN